MHRRAPHHGSATRLHASRHHALRRRWFAQSDASARHDDPRRNKDSAPPTADKPENRNFPPGPRPTAVLLAENIQLMQERARQAARDRYVAAGAPADRPEVVGRHPLWTSHPARPSAGGTARTPRTFDARARRMPTIPLPKEVKDSSPRGEISCAPSHPPAPRRLHLYTQGMHPRGGPVARPLGLFVDWFPPSAPPLQVRTIPPAPAPSPSRSSRSHAPARPTSGAARRRTPRTTGAPRGRTRSPC